MTAGASPVPREHETGGFERWIALVPDPLLPEQLRARHSIPSVSGERRLVAAILEDAVRSYLHRTAQVSRDSRIRRARRDSARWIFDDDRSWCFSFRNVCDLLGIDAARLRKSLWTTTLGRRGGTAREGSAPRGRSPSRGGRE